MDGRKIALAMAFLLASVMTQHAADVQLPEAPRTFTDHTNVPSPDAPQWPEYADLPFNYSQGSTTINLPLVTLPSSFMPLNIGLTYVCRSIDYDMPAGMAGLGWKLTGLGKVTRSICGMPDDKEYTAFDLRTSESATDADYFIDLIEYRKDALADRYELSTPDGNYTSFILTNGKITPLTISDLTVKRVADKSDSRHTEKFIVTSPDGIRYEYAEKEYVEYLDKPASYPLSYKNPNYRAVQSWNLTKIVAPEATDSILVTYTPGTNWERSNSNSLKSYSYTREKGVSTSDSFNSSNGEYSSYVVTLFENPPLPESITSSAGKILFSFIMAYDFSNSEGRDILSKVGLYTPQGKEIRSAQLDLGTLADGRRRLDKITITADGETVDGYKLAYFDFQEGNSKDFFGFPNGKQRNTFSTSVLNDNLELNNTRQSSASHISDGLLTKISSVYGMETSIDYEPSVWNAANGAYTGILGSQITIGTRIKSITSADKTTDRKKVRSFSYEDPALSADISSLGISTFIQPSGTIERNELLFTAPTTTSMSATLTGTCRMPGLPAESTRIFYRKVTETVSGTAMESPLVTEYEYDLSGCISPLSPCGHKIETQVDSDKFLGNFGSFMAGGDTQKYQKLFAPNLVSSYIREKNGAEPLLTKKTQLAYRGGILKPHISETYTYTTLDSTSVAVGLYYESAVYMKFDNNVWTHSIDSPNDVNFSPIYVDCVRRVCTGSKTTRHYADGNTRTISADYDYIGGTKLFTATPFPGDNARSIGVPEPEDNNIPLPGNYHPGFDADSIKVNYKHFLPLSVTYSCNNDTLTRYDLYSRDVHSSFYYRVTDCDILTLPVAQKFKRVWRQPVTSTLLSDSLEQNFFYGEFAGASGKFTRPVREVITHRSEILDCNNLDGYDRYGFPRSITNHAGVTAILEWNRNGELLSKLLPTSGHEWRYTYEPLVGVSSITEPSGRRHTYEYSAGRLSSETDTYGNTIRSYAYSLANPGFRDSFDGCNTIRECILHGGGTSAVHTRYDGFGKAISQLSEDFGSSGDVITQETAYDALGRPVMQNLPYPVGSAATEFYGDSSPWSRLSYPADGRTEPSVITFAGDDMVGHPALTEFTCNSDETLYTCRRYLISGNRLLRRGDYAPGELDATVSTSPDGNVSVVFTDWQGRTVLERKVLSEGEYADTYTVYDLWGNPLVVIPPELNALYNNSSFIFTGDKTHGKIMAYAFAYGYDDALRVVSYREPGVEPLVTSYDKYGRPAFITDGNLKLQSKSRYFLYDAIGRPVEEGICDAPQFDVSATSMTAVYSGTNQGTGTGYSTTVPLGSAKMRKAMYYDTYRHLSLPEFSKMPAECMASLPASQPSLLTGVMEAVDVRNAALSIDLTKYNTRRVGVFAYDAEGREMLNAHSFHRDSVYLVEYSTYNPDGSVAVSDNQLFHPSGNRSDKHRYIYDNYGRLVSERVEFDGKVYAEVAACSYDALGRAVSTFDGVMSSSSAYDIRGALKSTQSPLFRQKILRTDGAYPLFDGRISGIRDYLAGVGSFSNYHYDGMGRLIGAEAYVGGENRSSSYDYTLNGNPTNIVRLGDNGTGMAVPVDVLTMEYSGNQLVKATDAAGTIINESSHDFNDGANAAIEYTYDANGNTLTDLNKGVEAYEWDVDNRLASITMQDYSSPTVYYTRAAGGQKLSETQLTGLKKLEFNPVLSLTPGFATDENGESVNAANAVTVTKKPVSIARNYYGHYIYENDTFDRVLTSTGYFDVKGLHAYVRDWQGNVRGVARRIGAAPVLEQTTFYYPYGMPMAESTAPEMNRCKYSGKEYLTHAALNISDFDARILDHTIPRFLSTDVLSYDNTPNSSYIYCNSDPINHIDVTGNKCAVIYSNHGSLGHIALLAQQLDGKYHYFSFNGIEAFNSTSGSSGLPYNNLGGGPTFDSIEEFMNSKYNTEGNEESRFFQEACGYNYTKAIELDTTLDQDAIIVNDFKESAKKEYNLLFHNCADAVKDSLKSIINFSVQVNGFGTFIEILKLFYLTKGTDILYRSPSNPDETFRRIEEYESEQN